MKKVEFRSCLAEEMNCFLASLSSYSYSGYMHIQSALERLDELLAKSGKTEKSLSEDDVTLFRESLVGYSNRTVIEKMTALRKFSRYLHICSFPTASVFIPKEKNTYVPHIYSEDEIHRILEDADNIKERRTNYHPEYMLLPYEYPIALRILIFCGTRLGETLSIRLEDFDEANAVFILRKTKRNKEKIIPMDRSLAGMISGYVSFLGLRKKKSEYLFPGKDYSDCLTGHVIAQEFKNTKKRIGLSLTKETPHSRGICLHCFRHWFAIQSFRKAEKAGRPVNDSIPFLSTYMGHDSLD